jgi:nitrite reductase (NO-forming)
MIRRLRGPLGTALVTVIVAIVTACGSAAAPSWTYPPAAGGSPAAASPGADPPIAEGGVVGTIRIEAFDLGFTPGEISVDAPGRYAVELTNTGVAPHDVTFADGTSVAAAGGQSAAGEVVVPEAGLAFICSVPGHEAGGMAGAVTVAGHAAGGDDHGGPLPVGAVKADPNAPAYELIDPVAPVLLEGTTHDIDLVITEEEKTIAEGFVQKVWTFGGAVPGPVIRVKVGDLVRIHLKNPVENQLPHSIDFHSSMVAWNDEMTSIEPGGEKLYEFRAELAGVYMYHCGTSPALHHIANGMYGMMIVEPPEGLPPVDREFALVQSEWYLGEQGKEADLEQAMAAAPAPDFVLFNGVANQYLDNPIQVGVGESVRVFLLDAGPSIDSSFHVVGTIFDRVIKEGMAPMQAGWGAQAVDLSPAQGAIIEMRFAEDGLYPIVTHAFNFVGRGALGLFQAGDGDPLN